MSKITLLIAAGTPVFYLGEGLVGSLANDAVVDFGEASYDELAQAWANDPTISEAQKLVFLNLLAHTDEDGAPIRYTPQGSPVVLNPDQHEYFTMRAAIERGVEKANSIVSFASEEQEDAFSDTIAEEVARSTSGITSPSEAAEAEAIANNQEPAPPAPGPEPGPEPENPPGSSEVGPSADDTPLSGSPTSDTETPASGPVD